MFKSSRSIITDSLKKSPPNEEDFILEKLASVDGNQTIKKYKKMELLGKGGFANCFVTQSVETKRRAATKVIEKQVLTSQKTKLRLLNEIRLHKTLHHENVVEFYHYFQDKHNVYIFLQLCENQSLNQVIRTRQSFTTPQIQSFLYGIINGLKYLHNKGIIHRDLKLGNIFLDKKYRIKLGDFGLATKLQFRKQCKRTICGTPNYIAPQILQGKGYHFEVDIWAIGVILYTLYYTIPPFQTQQASTTYQKIKKIEYTIPKYGQVPQQANDLIQKILVKNPWQRPTLDEILESDFMKLGNKIYKQLPAVCSRKTPLKKDFQDLEYWTHEQIMRQIKSEALNTNKGQIQKQQQQKEYITQFEDLSEERYFYGLNTGLQSIYTPNQIVFRDDYGMVKSFNPNDRLRMLSDCDENPLKYLLNCQIKMRNQQNDNKTDKNQQNGAIKQKQHLLQATLYPSQLPLHIKKVSPQLKHNFYMVRLSNNTIQMIFSDKIDYLLSGRGDQIYQIKNNKIVETIILKEKYVLSNEQMTKIGLKKGKYLQGILAQIKTMKQKVQSKQKNKKDNQQVYQTPKFFQTPSSNSNSKQKTKQKRTSLFKQIKA